MVNQTCQRVKGLTRAHLPHAKALRVKGYQRLLNISQNIFPCNFQELQSTHTPSTFRGSALIDVERGMQLTTEIFDGVFVDDLFSNEIGHVKDVNGARRLSRDLGQMNVDPKFE